MEELKVMRKCDKEAKIICDGARWSDILSPLWNKYLSIDLFFFKSHNTSDSENQLMEIEVTSDCVAQGVENHDEDKYHGDIKFFLRPWGRRVIWHPWHPSGKNKYKRSFVIHSFMSKPDNATSLSDGFSPFDDVLVKNTVYNN